MLPAQRTGASRVRKRVAPLGKETPCKTRESSYLGAPGVRPITVPYPEPKLALSDGINPYTTTLLPSRRFDSLMYEGPTQGLGFPGREWQPMLPEDIARYPFQRLLEAQLAATSEPAAEEAPRAVFDGVRPGEEGMQRVPESWNGRRGRHWWKALTELRYTPACDSVNCNNDRGPALKRIVGFHTPPKAAKASAMGEEQSAKEAWDCCVDGNSETTSDSDLYGRSGASSPSHVGLRRFEGNGILRSWSGFDSQADDDGATAFSPRSVSTSTTVTNPFMSEPCENDREDDVEEPYTEVAEGDPARAGVPPAGPAADSVVITRTSMSSLRDVALARMSPSSFDSHEASELDSADGMERSWVGRTDEYLNEGVATSPSDSVLNSSPDDPNPLTPSPQVPSTRTASPSLDVIGQFGRRPVYYMEESDQEEVVDIFEGLGTPRSGPVVEIHVSDSSLSSSSPLSAPAHTTTSAFVDIDPFDLSEGSDEAEAAGRSTETILKTPAAVTCTFKECAGGSAEVEAGKRGQALVEGESRELEEIEQVAKVEEIEDVESVRDKEDEDDGEWEDYEDLGGETEGAASEERSA